MRLEQIVLALTDDWSRIVDRTDAGRPVERREYEQIDEFLGAVGDAASVPTAVEAMDDVHGSPSTAVLCDAQDVSRVADLLGARGARPYASIIALHAPLRPRSIELAQRLQLAGVIEEARYRVWRGEREDDPDGGVCGRKDVATTMGASWPRGTLSETEDYCFLVDERHHGLPELLGAYLVATWMLR